MRIAVVGGTGTPGVDGTAALLYPLLDAMFAATARVGVVPSGRQRLQPIDPRIVAGRVVEALAARPAGRLPDRPTFSQWLDGR